MPCLYHRPPKYCLHKATNQATVSLGGKRIYLGPFGSLASHEKYQNLLKKWHTERNNQQAVSTPVETSSERIALITPAVLRAKRRAGSPLTINELLLVYRRHTHQYYRKDGKITREATITDDVIRFLRKHHATMVLEDFASCTDGGATT